MGGGLDGAAVATVGTVVGETVGAAVTATGAAVATGAVVAGAAVTGAAVVTTGAAVAWRWRLWSHSKSFGGSSESSQTTESIQSAAEDTRAWTPARMMVNVRSCAHW